MSLVTLRRVFAAAVVIVSPVVVSADATSAPSTGNENEQKLQQQLKEMESEVQRLREQLKARQRLPFHLVVPPTTRPFFNLTVPPVLPRTQGDREGWQEVNPGRNTWHYLVPTSVER
jgi:hypothetical protein